MEAAKKLLAIYLFLVALAVALNFVLEPLYIRPAADHFWNIVIDGWVWDVLNWFMALAIVAAVIVWWKWKLQLDRQSPDQSITRRYLEVNVAFYAAAVLALWFFWNWFDNLASGELSQGVSHLSNWTFVDPLFVLIAAVTGRRLRQRSPGGNEPKS